MLNITNDSGAQDYKCLINSILLQLTIGTNYIDNVLSFHRYSTRVKLQKIGKKNSDLES